MRVSSANAARNFVPGEVLVKLRPGLDEAGKLRFAEEHHGRLLEQIDMPAGMRAAFGGDLVRLGVAAEDQALTELKGDDRVAYAERNLFVRPEIVRGPAPSLPPALPPVPALTAFPTGMQSRGLSPEAGTVLWGLAGAAALGAGGALLGSLLSQKVASKAVWGSVLGCAVGLYLAHRAHAPYHRPSEPTQARSLPSTIDSRLWGLDNPDGADMDAPEAWAITTGDRERIIAVMDTGLDVDHLALKGNLWTNPEDGSHGYNAIHGDHDLTDSVGHGTHCSGSIAGNGASGVFGVSHRAQLMGIKFMDGQETGTMAEAIKGLAFATAHGARLTNNSWNVDSYSLALKEAYAASPALHVCSAGNHTSNNDFLPIYPASFDLPNVIRVAASDRNDELAPCSNWGWKSVDVAAPGQDIYSSMPGNVYQSLSGTSMATAYVTGVANLLLSRKPDLTNAELKDLLLKNATPIPGMRRRIACGGVVDAARSLRALDAAP